MKHIKKILAVVSIAAATAMTFAACGPNANANVPPEHTHEFAQEWTYDATNHWHAATCEHDWVRGDEAKHVFTETTEGTATCTEGATVTRTCACGYSYTYTSDPLGHKWVEQEGKAADCKGPGYTAHYKCSECGALLNYQEIRQTEHNYHYEIVTEDEEGNPVAKHQEVCGFCGEVRPGSLQDHRFGAYLHDATNHWQACVCGEETEKAAHTFEQEKFAYNDEQHWYICDTCGEANPTKTDHEFDPVTGTCACGAQAEIKNYFTYTESGNNLTVTGMVAELDGKTEFAIPATFEGKAVTAIAQGAFAGNTTITRLVLPASIKTIGDFAFQGCTALKAIELPGVTTLGTFDYQVFNGCTALQAITLPAGITSIGQNMFKNCKALATVTLQGDVTFIDTQAFYGCEKLEGITLGAALSYIGQKAFAESGLKTFEVTMAAGGRIAQGAFENCEALTELSITGGINYFASPFLAGCSKLETLTLPFIGNYDDAAKATDTHFGYIFGKAKGAYAIPATLKTLNIKGGSVQLCAFANCGNLTINADAEVEVLTKTFTGYTGTFNWEGTLPGPTITANVDKAEVFVGDEVTLTYKAGPEYAEPNTPTVSVTVKKGDAAAEANTDYTVEGMVYTFLKQGEYTIVVTASYNGIEKSKEVKVTVDVHGPNLSEITASGETYNGGLCEVDKAITLSFTYDGDTETKISYAVKKGDAAATQADYTLDEANKTITFKTFGAYTVEVTAVRNGKTETKSIEIVATSADATPLEGVTITANTDDLTEGGEAFTFTVAATYAEGDSNFGTYYSVYLKEGGNTYSNADKSYYVIDGTAKTFKALVAGDYKITATVISKNGASGSADLTFTVKPVELNLELTSNLTNGWVRAKVGETSVTYTTGATYLDGYTMSFEKDIEAANIAAGNAGTLNLSLSEANTVNYKLVFTHKTVEGKVFTLKIPVSFVTDVDKAPVLGADPFGGTYGELLTATGLQLYWDVTDKATEGTQLALADVSFAVVDGSNTTGVTVSTPHIADNKDLPWYVLVEDWQAGNATGQVAVKLTATKDGATAAATKLFTVKSLANPDSATGMNDYAAKVMGEKSKDIDFDCIMLRGNRENAVLSKDGIVEHRSGADWQPSDNALCVRPNGMNNFKLEFDWTILKRTTNDNKTSFTVHYRAGSRFEDWVGYKNSFYTEGEILKAGCWEGDTIEGVKWGEKCPPATIGQPVHVRLTHTLSNNIVEFNWEWSTDGTTYTPWLSWKNNASSSGIGSPVYALQFAHECGAFSWTNFKLTNLDA